MKNTDNNEFNQKINNDSNNNEDKSWCVYVHTNIINDKKYVGQTCYSKISKRWGPNGNGYLHKNKTGEYQPPHFANAIIKYGWDNFTHEILCSNLTKDQADELEKETIIRLDTRNPQKGYNLQEGGSRGRMSEESKKKLSKSLKGLMAGENNPMYGKRGKLSPNWGKKYSQDRLDQMSKRMMGENNPMYGITKEFQSLETRYAKGSATRGKSRSEETKNKISEGIKKYYEQHENKTKGIPRSNETKKKISEKLKGRIFSDETKKKMSENHHDIGGENNPRARKVRCIETGEIFGCASDAGKKYGLTPSNPGSEIRKCCKNSKMSAGVDDSGNPLHWEYIMNDINDL